MVTTLFAKLLFAVAALLLSLSAFAGGIFFELSLAGSQLTVINKGDGSAYYPAVFRLLDTGSWERLAPAKRADMSVMRTMGLPSAYISASQST